MPYAQLHYPFENKDRFENGFPADFIAEGLDQTRGWFYTLMVLSTALFDKPAFKNLVVNGLVLAADGKKMSKRLQNYPDPMNVVSKYGADALRMYLVNSPVRRPRAHPFGGSGPPSDAYLRLCGARWCAPSRCASRRTACGTCSRAWSCPGTTPTASSTRARAASRCALCPLYISGSRP